LNTVLGFKKKKRDAAGNDPTDNDDDIANMMFGGEGGSEAQNALFERKRVTIKDPNHGSSSDSTDSDSDDEDGATSNEKKKGQPGSSRLSRKKSIRMLEGQLEENLEDFLENKSNTSAFQAVRERVMDLKDQLVRLKEKEKEKEKAKLQKNAAANGQELTEEEIAALMFAEDDFGADKVG